MRAADPIVVTGQTVLPEWIDYNGHMNVAFYVLAFDKALDQVCDRLDLGVDYVRRTSQSIFVLEMHVTYLREVVQGDPLRFSFQMLDCDDKRFHYMMTMQHGTEGFDAALSEQIALHVDLKTRRSAPFPADARQRLQALLASHQRLPRPPGAGRVIGIRRKAPA